MILTGGSGLLLKKIKVKSQAKMTTRNMLTDKPQMSKSDLLCNCCLSDHER